MPRIFIISNRVGVPNRTRGVHPGGLEVALRATLQRHACVWMGWSGEVKPAGETKTRTVTQGGNSYIVTDLSEEDYQEYYNGFANRVLWPILHYRIDLAEFSRRDLTGYLRVNQHFADRLDGVLAPDDVVWVHDYHLIPLARALRERGRENRIGFFLHIPLPPPEILTAMPNHEKLIPSLTDYDLVGFQTDGDAANFARYLATECGMPAHIRQSFEPGRRVMRIGTFPVGIAAETFQRCARRATRSAFVRRVADSVPGVIIIGVDRLDYSKGLPLRLDAFERFLTANPQWRGKVTYMQITPKSRSDVPEYAEVEHAMDTAAGRINSTYGDVSWTPVRYTNRPYSRTALAGLYRASRVALVTPLRDGMNLVSKEYVAAQDPADPGVLILSRFAGAAAEFGASALLVNPYDPEAVGAAIARAIAMPREERVARHAKLFEALERNDVAAWGDRFLSALTETAGPQRRQDPVAPLRAFAQGNGGNWGKVAPRTSGGRGSTVIPGPGPMAATTSLNAPPRR
ncbi:MAG TPA: trehalose-6-phosphate synthase [Rhizomicrobium sp.]|nr:trehalose-6-phosphate synthase [Rhizomicrobium sp.]